MVDIPWTLLPSWLDSSKALKWKNQIINNVKWEQPIVKVYAKEYLVPRLTVFIANKNTKYIYSGFEHIGEGWPEWLLPLLEEVRESTNTDFNGCLINFYRDGKDKMGWHADNEKELDAEKSIASLSLGASRDFILKNKINNIKKSISLENGDLLIMHPICQTNWVHCVPLRKKLNETRVNLTFRCYK